jgi:hypothetical protein
VYDALSAIPSTASHSTLRFVHPLLLINGTHGHSVSSLSGHPKLAYNLEPLKARLHSAFGALGAATLIARICRVQGEDLQCLVRSVPPLLVYTSRM